MWTSWYARTSIGFLIAAGCLYLVAVLLPLIHNWEPLIYPVSLAPGSIRTPEFKTDLNTKYEIDLDLERKLDPDRMDCLLGVKAFFLKPCEDTPDVVDISWKVLSRGKVVAEGDSKGNTDGYWGPTVGRTIGRFDGHRRQRYSLALAINRDASQLNIANPRIKIGVHPREYEGYLIWTQVCGIAALLCLAIGLLVFVFRFGILRLFSRRKWNQ